VPKDEERCLPGHPTSWAALAPSTAWGVGRPGCNANATGVGDRCGCGSVRRCGDVRRNTEPSIAVAGGCARRNDSSSKAAALAAIPDGCGRHDGSR
jgi:hypothetical protein